MSPAITRVTAFRVRVPLVRPYHLSIVTLEAFDSVIVRVEADGSEAFGEVTDCPGYYTEGVSDAWDFVRTFGADLLGREPGSAVSAILSQGPASFASAALLTALEHLARRDETAAVSPGAVPLMGVLQGETSNDLVQSYQRLSEKGYTTFKQKIGFSVTDDLERVRQVQSCLGPGDHLRLDANQGYSYGDARHFLEGLSPEGIELVEQPLGRSHWDDMIRLSEMSPVLLMLDEAIEKEEDLDRTIETDCAGAVKFKLMKSGSFAALEKMIEKATQAGLRVILGNGVASDLGCLHEAQIALNAGLTVHAGEMNGFLKCTEHLLRPGLRVEHGALRLPDSVPAVQWDLVSQLAVDTMTVGR